MKLLSSSVRATAAAVILLSALGAGADEGIDAARDGQHDFDFYVGTWRLHNRRLKGPLTGSTTWYEFDATSVARKVWDGKANMDEFEADTPTGHIQGLTLRLYDPKAHQWSLYWANSALPGPMGPPTVGAFDKDGHGEFFDQETFQGRSILVRYIWSGITSNSCHWEQAFSVDGGKTWETNWVIDATRAP